jgi:pyruvate dehydrogenase (quinone)/pyruvate oxidase
LLQGPVLIECPVDPHEPPMPARVKQKHAKNMAAALMAGTPNRKRIALTIVRDMLDESSFEASPSGGGPAGTVARTLERVLPGGDGKQKEDR